MARQRLQLTSPTFAHGEPIPARHTCEADDISPALSWRHAPDGTRSFVLIMDDEDAPGGVFTHWLLFDIPGSVPELPQNASGVGIAGRNDFQADGYGGPCPPPNHPPHRYHFRLFALDIETLGLEAGASREEIESAMEGHVLAEAGLMGRFERRPGPTR